MNAVNDMLRRFDSGDHDALFPLRVQGPTLYERLFGKRPHRSMLYRLAQVGRYGVKLVTVEDGSGRLLTSIRWLCEWAVAVSAARGRRKAVEPDSRPSGRRRHRAVRRPSEG